jgi:tryptophanyl-tRNA synthetase
VFKQYREGDGRFYFKLTAVDGRVLLQSEAFGSGREAGQWVARLRLDGAAAVAQAPVQRGAAVTDEDLEAAWAALAAAAG